MEAIDPGLGLSADALEGLYHAGGGRWLGCAGGRPCPPIHVLGSSSFPQRMQEDFLIFDRKWLRAK
jgi:hypothetical protein